ncbi:MAG TPA: DNA adenine methylase, partial [Solirubrobacteraceae bacterium]|nr:DNA adenine methylase [Solirubrobacteraceae bacterium]
DSLEPLAALWARALAAPGALAGDYERLWRAGLDDPAAHYLAVRERFNAAGGPAELLYLLARCVKSAPRFNAAGAFNQSADRRRLGMRPERMRREIAGAATLLAGRAVVRSGDFRAALADATPADLVYLDPPWQGTSSGRDRRYRDGLDRRALIAALEDLDARGVPWLLSYDGRHGERTYGEPLPAERIGASRVELVAGRSSQATLGGRRVTTVESLYVSRHLAGPAVRARAAAA